MTLLLLIRHAENDARKTRLVGRMPGIHLNEQGREQAQQLARTLAKEPIQAVYTSPLERAVETAQPLAKALNLPVHITPDLIEIDYGQWQGRTYKQLKRSKLWQEVGKDPSNIRFPDGETFIEAQQRAVTALEGLASDSDMIAVFTHADIILLTLAHYLHMPINDFYRLEIKPASLSVVELKDGRVRILHVNQVLDLELSREKPEE